MILTTLYKMKEHKYIVIVIGNFEAKIGLQREDNTTRKYGYENRNEGVSANEPLMVMKWQT